MNSKYFTAIVGLLAASLGMKPEEIVKWFHTMSQRYSSDRNTKADYLSTVLAPFSPQLFILADSKRKTLFIGGSGSKPLDRYSYKLECASELLYFGEWLQFLKPYHNGEVVIPQSVVSIESKAFYFTDIKRLRINARITELPDSVCFGCNKLTSVILPDTLEIIEDSAFQYCSKLEEINIPDSVQFIGKKAFKDCYVLPEDTKAKILEIGGPEAFGEKEESRP